MLQLIILASALALTVGYTVLHERERTVAFTLAEGEVAATNFLSYRESVVKYKTANPTATSIGDAVLTWQLGFIRDSRWQNTIFNGVLYVYSVDPAQPAMLQAVYNRTGKSVMVGIKSNSGNLINSTGQTLPAVIPTVVPVGAIVYIGA